MARKFDIIIWGATGFTGQLAAKYLSKAAPAQVRWAIAGRSREKLEALASDIQLDSANIIVADSNDPVSLAVMVSQTKVLISMVGPYAIYGDKVVDACVQHSTHYCDITGEYLWVKRMIDRHHAEAKRKGVKIVHFCGFDSIPADLGCLMMSNAVRERYNQRLRSVSSLVYMSGAGASGGTIASMLNMCETTSGSLRELQHMADPYLLWDDQSLPRPRKVRSGDRDRFWLGYNRDAKTWVVPFVMQAVNNRCVRRSYSLLRGAYGSDFEYSEAQPTRSLLRGLLFVVGLFVFLVLAQFRLGRALFRRIAPKPGEGPSETKRKNSSFRYLLLATTEDGRKIYGIVSGGDPGYDETAKMVVETALCIALQPSSDSEDSAGVVTPAVAGDVQLIERLRAAGMEFRTIDT